MKNGFYAIGWVTDTIDLSSDPNWNISASVGEHQTFRVWAGGIVQYEITEDSYWMGVGNYVGPGYVTLVPKEVENTFQIIRYNSCKSHNTRILIIRRIRKSSSTNFIHNKLYNDPKIKL